MGYGQDGGPKLIPITDAKSGDIIEVYDRGFEGRYPSGRIFKIGDYLTHINRMRVWKRFTGERINLHPSTVCEIIDPEYAKSEGWKF